MLFSFSKFIVTCQGLVIPKMLEAFEHIPSTPSDLSDPLGNISLAIEQGGMLSFSKPAYFIEKDVVSIVSHASLNHSSLPKLQEFTIVSKINSTATKLRSMRDDALPGIGLKSVLLDAQDRVVRDERAVKHLTKKFIGHLNKKLDENGVLLRQRLTCQSDLSNPSVLVCLDPESLVKRAEPEIQAQVFGQLLHKLKQTTEKVSDNVDFLNENPREFLSVMDEKFDDKILAIAEKWEEATQQLSSMEDKQDDGEYEDVLMAAGQSDRQEEEEESAEAGYIGFHGFNVEPKK